MSSCNAYLIVKDVNQLIAFMEAVFGASVLKKKLRDNGSIAYAEIAIDDAVIMASEPKDGRYYPASMYIYVADCNYAFTEALTMQAEIHLPPTVNLSDKEKYAAVKDTNDNIWWIVERLG